MSSCKMIAAEAFQPSRLAIANKNWFQKSAGLLFLTIALFYAFQSHEWWPGRLSPESPRPWNPQGALQSLPWKRPPEDQDFLPYWHFAKARDGARAKAKDLQGSMQQEHGRFRHHSEQQVKEQRNLGFLLSRNWTPKSKVDNMGRQLAHPRPFIRSWREWRSSRNQREERRTDSSLPEPSASNLRTSLRSILSS